MAYNVYPYSYRNARVAQQLPEELFEFSKEEPKRGDLEGYLAAKDFASQAYSSCMYSKAQVNIRQLNNLRPDMTAKEYMNILIKQGQVPEKHFKYQRKDDCEVVTELNSYRDVVKRVIFDTSDNNDTPVISKYYNPDSGELFKEVFYKSDGNKDVKFYQPEEGLLPENELIESSAIQSNATVPINKAVNPFDKLQSA